MRIMAFFIFNFISNNYSSVIGITYYTVYANNKLFRLSAYSIIPTKRPYLFTSSKGREHGFLHSRHHQTIATTFSHFAHFGFLASGTVKFNKRIGHFDPISAALDERFSITDSVILVVSIGFSCNAFYLFVKIGDVICILYDAIFFKFLFSL
jgi:hypothetical protein